MVFTVSGVSGGNNGNGGRGGGRGGGGGGTPESVASADSVRASSYEEDEEDYEDEEEEEAVYCGLRSKDLQEAKEQECTIASSKVDLSPLNKDFVLWHYAIKRYCHACETETWKGKSGFSFSAHRGHVRNVGRSAVYCGGAFAILRVVEGSPSYRVGEGPGSDLPQGRTHSPLLHPRTDSAAAVTACAIPNRSRQTGTLLCTAHSLLPDSPYRTLFPFHNISATKPCD